jgi:hypothetical protein
MSTIPLRIDTELVHQARAAGSLFERPPTAQIEFWAKLGRAVEAVLTGESVAVVKQLARVEKIDEVLALTRTERGREKARAVIAQHKGPIYSTDPASPEVIVETQPDGRRRRGRFENRKFIPLRRVGKTRG